MAEDVDWGTTGTFPGTEKSYQGTDGLVEWMGEMRSAWESFEVAIEEVIAETEAMLVIAEKLHARGLGSGVEVEMRTYGVYWYEGGKIKRRRAFTEREQALAAAGLGER